MHDYLKVEELEPQVQDKSSSEIFSMILKRATEVEKELNAKITENKHFIIEEYNRIVFQKRHWLLFLNSAVWFLCHIPLAYYIIYRRLGIRIRGISDDFKPEKIILGIFMGMLVFIAVSLFSLFLHLVGLKVPSIEYQAILLKSIYGNRSLLLWSLYSVALLTGIIEELYFRGYLLRHYAEEKQPRLGLWITSIIFGFMHYAPGTSPVSILILVFVGFIFGYVYLKSRNIWASISAHVTFNAIGLIVAYFFGDKLEKLS